MTFENLEVLQSNQKIGSEHDSVYSTSNCINSRALPWSSSGSHVSQFSSSKDVNMNMARHANHIKLSGFQLLHQDSSSTQSTSQSHQEEMSEGNFHGECVSSQSGTDANEKQNDDMKSGPPLGTPDIIFPRPKFDSNQATACYSYPCGGPYQMALMAAYGSHVVVHPQLLGMTSALAPLPLQPEGPIYVNPKQYRRILQRRQERARLEAQNKITKDRRSYLHESRHIHALKRVRGSGGRFLNTKQLQQQAQTSGTMGIQDDLGSSLQRTVGSSATSTCSEATNSSNSSDMFQQYNHHSFSVSTQSHGGVADSIGFML